MSQQQPEKLTARTTPEKPRPQQPFVQLEGKLTLEQLEAIALWHIPSRLGKLRRI